MVDMRSARLLPVLSLLFAPVTFAQFQYPDTRKSDHVDEYFGTPVPDPYRWLEDANSEETKAWVNAQNRLTRSYLDQIPERAALRARLKKIWNYERFGMPFKEGGKYFFTRNDGLQNQSPLYVADSLRGKPRLLLDPNKLSKGGVDPVGGYAVSRDGRYLAYYKSSGGSDWQEWFVRDVKTGKDLPDHIKWAKFTGASWSKDGKGFYYGRFNEPVPGQALQEANYFQKLYYHKVGTPQSQDRLIYERKDHKDWGFGAEVSEDGRYLFIYVSKGSSPNNSFFYRDLKTGGPVVELLTKFDANYSPLGNDGPVFYFQTDKAAPLNRIIAIDIRNPAPERWKTIVPQAKEKLQSVSLLGDRFFCSYLKDAQSVVKVYSVKGKPARTVGLPGMGTAGGFGGHRTDRETFYNFSSFTSPNTIYRYDIGTGKSSVFRRPKLPFSAASFVSKQVFYKSKDGTRVPMFLVYKKGLKLDGNNPVKLTSYGGFNASLTPYFSVINAIWLEMGGVFAQPNIRGGGEYGKAWHEAGTKERKQNVFDDFIAAAEWLIANRYTKPSRLAIEGGSNGGLLVGACELQRPDLFGVCLPALGVMDMLRFHKFTIGWAWVSDYGSSDTEEGFKYLIKYSPAHNVRVGENYPATLVTTADHDDRVVPAHSYKFTSAMQAAQAGAAPIMIRIETQAGHGTITTAKRIEEEVDVYAFVVKNLGMRLPTGFGK